MAGHINMAREHDIALITRVKSLVRLKMLTEARGELFAPLPLPQLATIKARLQSKGQ